MEQLTYTPFTEVGEEKRKDLRQILSKYLYHWPLFLICLMCTTALAYVYIRHTIPVYQIKAKVALKDDKNQPLSGGAAALEQLNISSKPKFAESEVEILKSRPVIKKVVDELQLWCNYYEKSSYTTLDLYATTPFRFKFIQQKEPLKDYNFSITINSTDSYTIVKPDQTELKGKFTNTLNSSFGKWQLVPTANLKYFIGRTVLLHLQSEHKTISDYQEKIITVLNKTTPIIEMKIEDEVFQRGTAVLNKLVAVYKSFNVIDKNKETESTLKFIDERLTSLTQELTSVEKDVEGYKSSVGLTDISAKSQVFLDNVQANDSRLNEVNVQLNVIEGVEKYVNAPDKSDHAPATIGITDPGLINLVAQMNKLQVDKERLLAITPENNPIFVPINRQIKSTQNAIKENVNSIKTSLTATKRQLNSFNSGLEAGIKNMPGEERQYVSIKRQQGIKESLYVYLLQKREEVALSYASTLTDARTVEEAYYDDPKTSKKIPLFIALLAGLLVPAGMITGRSILRNRVLTKDDIAAITAAPVICELIQENTKKPLVVLDRDAYAIGEQMRGLRTNLLHAYDRKGKVVLFTSSIPKEGKSYVSSNIATSLAMLGKRTIILELDLRKPQISKIFNLTADQLGLSEYLSGKAAKEEIIVPSGVHPNLFVMRSGAVPENPSELIGSDKMAELITELRADFDNVLIDTPPLHLVTDATILAPMCDVSLYLIRHNYTPKSELKFIDEVYREGKLVNMSLVFNGVQMDSRYGYNLDYGYYKDRVDLSPWFAPFRNFSTRF